MGCRIFLIIVIFFVSNNFLFAQNKQQAYIYNIEKVTNDFPFKSLIVLDLREDNSNLGIIQKGAFNSKAILVAEIPIEKQIEEYFNSNNSNSTNAKDEYVLAIQKFCISEMTGAFSESGFFDFRAKLFIKVDDKYSLIRDFDKISKVKGVDVTKKILRTSYEVVYNFITQGQSLDKGKYFTWEQLQILTEEEKKAIPLYVNNTLKDGLYKTFSELKNQNSHMAEIIEKKTELYQFYTKNEKGKLKGINPNNYYALVKDGKLFVKNDQKFYPCIKENGEFTFIGLAKVTPSSGKMVAASLAFGILGAAIASSNKELFVLKLDYLTGDFVIVDFVH